jgi:CheY-like chemotaxis protein
MKKATILLAEDNKLNRRNLAVYLRSFQLHVVETNDGQEALDLVRNGLEFDALVTDYQMPRLNGGQLIEQLRQDGYTQPMIVWTAMIQLPVCPGADHIISKLSGPTTVLKALQQCLWPSP